MTDKERAEALQGELDKLQKEYFNERFQRVYDNQNETNRRLDYGFKESRENIAELFERLEKVEGTEKACPIEYVKNSLERHKVENVKKFDEVDGVIEGLGYYQKHPGQLKLLLIGAMVFFILNIGLLIYQFKDLLNK